MTAAWTLDISLLAAGTPPGGSGSLFTGLLPIFLMLIVFYVLLILPAQRRQKKHQQMLGAIKTGDQVITQGGIYGTVVAIDESDNTIQLRIADQVKVKAARASVAALQPSEAPKEKEK